MMKNFTLLLTLLVSVFSAEAQQSCGATFTDSGGVAGNYSNNEISTYTICPDVPDTMVKVTFTSFSMETNFDGMYVYDGNSVSAPPILSANNAGFGSLNAPGAYWGYTPPAPFQSSSVDGCLTFKFLSDNEMTFSGWIADVTCVSLPSCMKPMALATTAITPSSALASWVGPDNAMSYEVIAVPCGSPAPSASSAWTQTDANSAEFTGLTSQSCYSWYVRAICSDTDASLPAGPKSFTTPYTPPVCGGYFYDNGGPSANYSLNANSVTTICPDTPGDVVMVTFTSFSTESFWDGMYVYSGDSTAGTQIASANEAGSGPLSLPGAYWGNSIPGPFISSSADGCLTFWFKSDGAFNRPGWTADVECISATTSTVRLIAFVDENGNGIKDSGEQPFGHGTFTTQANNTGPVANINPVSGDYLFLTGEEDSTYDLNFNIYPEYQPYYALAATASFDDVAILADSGNHVFYFPVTLEASYTDTRVVLMWPGAVVPGTSTTNKIIYSNLGLTPASGTITFTADPNLTITTISQAGTVPTTTGFTYTFTDLQPSEHREINVQMLVPALPAVTLAQVLTNDVSATAMANDFDLTNNAASNSRIVTASYDPNDIHESHGPQIVHSDFTDEDFLIYTIRFQNTGNANATTVRVEDLLDSQLEFGSIRMISASHAYTMTRIDNQLTWQFDDIQLVPESVNSEDSNGYIMFKIKPHPGYAVGDIIPNTAEIYFDTNPAIITNTFNTEFVTQLAVADFRDNNLMLFPNPATSSVQVSIAGAGDALETVTIYDVLGKPINRIQAGTASILLDVSNLSKGIYIVEITTAAQNRQIRKLIIK